MSLDLDPYFLPVEAVIETGAKIRDFAKAYEKLEQVLGNIRDVLMLVYECEFAPLEKANAELVEMHRQNTIIINQLRKALKHATEPTRAIGSAPATGDPSQT